MGARDRAAAVARLRPQPGAAHLLVVATGPYAGEGFDWPALDILFLAPPVAQKGRLVQYAGRILRPCEGKTTAEVHDYHDELTGVLASSIAKRAPGYTSLGFPGPRLAGLIMRILCLEAQLPTGEGANSLSINPRLMPIPQSRPCGRS